MAPVGGARRACSSIGAIVRGLARPQIVGRAPLACVLLGGCRCKRRVSTRHAVADSARAVISIFIDLRHLPSLFGLAESGPASGAFGSVCFVPRSAVFLLMVGL